MDQQTVTGKPGRYWHLLEDGRIQCDLCPRLCKLHEGQRGLCFVRAREGDQVVLTTYGRSSGFCIDPIEKKPLNHFLPGTPVLSFGTAGCNLTCKFCQNWDISKAREFDRLQDLASPERIAEAAVASGCRSVAFTYNDPVIFLEYAVDVAQACRERGIKSVAVSAGYICDEPRVEFFRHMDAANIDLKGFTEEFYKNLCSARLGPVLDTLEYLKHETEVWFEITTLLIPGENDSPSEIEALSRWVLERLGPDVPLHFTAFHPDWKMLATPATPPETLRMARRIAQEVGLRYVYTGNTHDAEGQSTYCHACQAVLIGRDWYQLTAWNLTADGCCGRCGTPCPGVFEGAPGTWGPRRRPVVLRAATGNA
ncbi:AmmeMemoRadiSam system radical SAM enzyme [Microvirga sp. KLBC 81]|uniref:AmmeMemoRadiSam system radical SAM enzyme n=1 Tax=Microvirga sp. KLBC 81 TaxID=1862707 RepID=UPI000D506349|nr:AmmeMemoRadiSam system radical SAM enzyme [Microvirga sp. KLBC 81]PVE21650.1 AmmeMemoRadiSam system radical SAM enzyme [Microvirga sp. KLBC 81]